MPPGFVEVAARTPATGVDVGRTEVAEREGLTDETDCGSWIAGAGGCVAVAVTDGCAGGGAGVTLCTGVGVLVRVGVALGVRVGVRVGVWVGVGAAVTDTSAPMDVASSVMFCGS